MPATRGSGLVRCWEKVYCRLRIWWFTAVAWFLPRHSVLARIVRSRGCKVKPRRKEMGWVAHLATMCNDFAPDTDVLVLGSSHPFHAINPARAKHLRMWNASIIAGDIYTAYHLYLAFRKRWPWRPNQMVLLGEDFWQVSYQMEFTIYFPTSVALHLLAGVPYRRSALMRPYERVIKGMLSELSGAPPPQNVYRGHGILRELEGKSAAERFARHRAFTSFVPTELQWLIRLREAVEADGRRLALVRIPHRADYVREGHAAGVDLWATAASAREGVPLLDFFELQPPNPICFANADHLSPEGADWFTPIVERDLIRLNTHQQE